jgi:2,5-diketo-D-gluconate reductase B
MEFISQQGEDVPKLGLGTWQMEENVTYESVSDALELGYRYVDTAQLYENENEVGRAIADAGVDRDDIFLTTKVDPSHRSVREILGSAKESADRLGVDAVDLLLIHWPHPLANLETVMDGLNEARDEGLTRHIGVSNFDKSRLQKAQRLSDAPIFANQVLFHPWWPQRELLSYCQDTDVILTAYSPLANGGAIDDDLLWELGDRYDKTGPQVALRWATQHKNVRTIPMSTTRGHQEANIDIFDFKLTREEHDRITRPSYLKTGLSVVQGQLGV